MSAAATPASHTQKVESHPDLMAAAAREIEACKEAIARFEAFVQPLTAHAVAVEEACAEAVTERDLIQAQVEEVEARIRQVHQIVARYSRVEEPVVASDGFTYEKRTILGYLDDCQREGARPLSNQGDVEITDVLVPNLSLKRMVDQLKNIKVPPPEGTTTAEAALHAAPFVPASAKAAAASSAAASSSGIAAQPQPSKPIAATSFSAFVQQQAQTTQQQAQQRPANAAQLPPPPPPSQATGSGMFQMNGRTISGNVHPCIRVFGKCSFANNCDWANFPAECCLNHLKGRCKYSQDGCRELHLDPTSIQMLKSQPWMNLPQLMQQQQAAAAAQQVQAQQQQHQQPQQVFTPQGTGGMWGSTMW